MKTGGHTEDLVFEKLLRSGVRRTRQTACSGFDPDLAGAYLEAALTIPERTSFESHLVNCDPCRTQLVALSRFVEIEEPVAVQAAPAAAVVAQTGFMDRLKDSLSMLLQPRFAMAAVAVLVAAVSITLLISNRVSKNQVTSEPGVLAEATEGNGAFARGRLGDLTTEQSGNESQTDGPESDTTDGLLAKAPAAPGLPGEDAARDEQTGAGAAPAETGASSLSENRQLLDLAAPARAAEAEPAPAPAQPTGTVVAQAESTQGATRLARIDPITSLRLPESKDSAQVTPLKPGVTSSVEDTKEEAVATIRERSQFARRDQAADSQDSDGRGVSGRPRMASGIRAEGESAKSTANAKPAERRVGGKRFFRIQDVWTDSSFDGAKEMAVVTVVRNSEVYKKLIASEEGLRKIFEGFGESDRATIVFKGIAYRLVPAR